MNEEKLSESFKEALADWFESFELVEFLQLDVKDVINAFEDEILDRLDELKDELKWNLENELEED